MNKNKKDKISGRVDVRLTENDKKKLESLAKRKGCDGVTGLLRLLAKAKDVDVKI